MSLKTSEIYSFYNENIHNWLLCQRISVRKQYLESLDIISGDYVLDIGCGCGIDIKLLNEFDSNISGVGIDFSQTAINIARKVVDGTKWDLKCVDFRQYTNDRKFDIIIFSMLIMHYNDIRPVFHKLKELLAPNGKILVVTNNPYVVANEFNICYNLTRSTEYTHRFVFTETDVKYVTKFLHPINDYINKAAEEHLRLVRMLEISSYTDDTLLFNPTPSNLPNFLAFIYEQ